MEDKYKKVEYINSDGTRNWEANILFDNVKRLEQENAELKAVHKQLKQIIKSKESLLEKAMQENKELKARRIKSLGFICDCEEREKYKQAFEEIMGICEMDCGDCPYNQDCDCNYEECEEVKIDDILDKINEIIGDKNNE